MRLGHLGLHGLPAHRRHLRLQVGNGVRVALPNFECWRSSRACRDSAHSSAGGAAGGRGRRRPHNARSAGCAGAALQTHRPGGDGNPEAAHLRRSKRGCASGLVAICRTLCWPLQLGAPSGDDNVVVNLPRSAAPWRASPLLLNAAASVLGRAHATHHARKALLKSQCCRERRFEFVIVLRASPPNDVGAARRLQPLLLRLKGPFARRTLRHPRGRRSR